MPGTVIEKYDAAAAALAELAMPPTPPADNTKSYTLSQYAQLWLAGNEGMLGTSLGGPANPYSQSSWFHICVTRIAANCSRVPLRLSRGEAAGTRATWGARGVRAGRSKARRVCAEKSAWKAAEGEIVEFGDLYKFLRRPNPGQRWNQFFLATLILLHTYGRVHWLFDEMVGHRPLSMYTMPGHKSRAIVDKNGNVEKLAGWMFRNPHGVEYPVLLDECLTFQFFDPARPMDALEPREPARLAIIGDYNASLYNAAMFANGCEPGTVLETDAPFNPELDEQMRTNWLQRHQGAANARKLATLWGGLKHKSVGQTLNEMVWPEGKKMNAVEICGVMNVPPAVAGILGVMGDSEAFVENELKRFWQDTIATTLDEFCDAINDEISPRFDGNLEAWFDVEDVPVYQQMRRERMKDARDLFAMGRPWGDINDVLDIGMPARDWDETGFLPANLMPVEQAMQIGALPPMDEPTTEPVQEDAATGPETKNAAADDPVVKDAAGRLWNLWQRSWAPLAKRTAGIYARHYAAQQRKIIKLLREQFSNDQTNPKSQIKNQKSEATVASILFRVFDDAAERRKFLDLIRPQVADSYELGARQALAEAGFSGEAMETTVSSLVDGRLFRDAIKQHTVRTCRNVDAFSRSHIRRQLLSGMADGENVNQLADRVETFMGGRRGSALVTARNTIGQGLSHARRQGRLAAGVTHEVWLYSRGPGDRRPAHIEAEARYARKPKPVGQPFSINGHSLEYPRDPAAPPGERVNCQCVAIGKRIDQKSQPDGRTIIIEQLAAGFVGHEQLLATREQPRRAGTEVSDQESEVRKNENDES